MPNRTLRTILATFSVLSALTVLLVGCGAAPAGDPATQQAALTTPAPAPTDDDTIGGGSGPTDPTALGKQCWVDCSVYKSDPAGPVCPGRVTGYGKTTFLGGCGKACTHAEGDAASKLAAGCSLDNCTRRGC